MKLMSNHSSSQEKKVDVSLLVNGKLIKTQVSRNLTLLRFLRDIIHLTGTKEGCSQGECGSCTVIVDGRPEKACLLKVQRLNGKNIETIEGLSKNGELHPLQQAFIDEGAVQCGFCTPGMIMAAKVLLDRIGNPTLDDIKETLQGNLCRCTGYISIARAIEQAAKVLSTKNAPTRNNNTVRPHGIQIIGASVPDKDGVGRVTGKLKFADDIYFGNMLYGAILFAKFPHAEILNIDTSKTERMPGVQAVLTSKNITGSNIIGPYFLDRPVIADKRVRFIGDIIAVVFAEDRDIAEKARDNIKVDYKELEVISDPRQAMEPGAISIHDQGNIIKHAILERGDIQRGFSQADIIVEEDYTTPFVEHGYLEPEAGLAMFSKDGILTVWYGTQTPFIIRELIATNLKLSKEKVRVIATPIGGGFGGKIDVTIEIILALGAFHTKRPVKITLSREESLRISTKRHAYYMHYKTGVKSNGILTSLEAKIISDAGAYSGYSPSVLEQSMVFAGGPYQWPNVRIEGYCVYTNNVLGGAFRGFGVNQVHFAVESQLDIIAHKLRMDPFDLRLKNALDVGSVTITGERLESSVAIKETIQKARRALKDIPFQKFKGQVGIGIASGYKNVGTGRGNVNFAGAKVELREDGRVLVRASAVDMGQGVKTVLAQIASAITGIDYNRIDVLTGDTLLVPTGVGAYAQRQTYVTGNAVLGASKKFKEELINFISEEFEIEGSRISFEGEKIIDAATGRNLLTIDNLAQLVYSKCKRIEGDHEYHAPKTYPIIGDGQPVHPLTKGGGAIAFDTLTSRLFVDESSQQQFNEVDPYPEDYRNYFTYNYVTQIAILKVDKKDGAVKLLCLISAHDVGKMINPQKIKGQLEGSAIMGMGYALKEQFLMRDGWNITNSLRKCGIPTFKEIPDVKLIVVEDPEPGGPFGAKGIGEAALVPTAAAITNAIYDAIGIRIKNLPANRERVREEIFNVSQQEV